MGVKIQLLRGSAVAWSGANPTLSAGQPGFETDTNKLKIGDGSTAWNSLSYLSSSSGSGVSLSLEEIQDDMSTFLVAGSGISLNYNDGGNTFTVATSGVVVLSPTAISSSQNNYNPGGGDVFRISASASGVNLTGMVAGAEKLRLLLNIGSTHNITLVHESASSTAANRFIAPNGGNYIVAPTGSATVFYDDTSARWRIV